MSSLSVSPGSERGFNIFRFVKTVLLSIWRFILRPWRFFVLRPWRFFVVPHSTDRRLKFIERTVRLIDIVTVPFVFATIAISMFYFHDVLTLLSYPALYIEILVFLLIAALLVAVGQVFAAGRTVVLMFMVATVMSIPMTTAFYYLPIGMLGATLGAAQALLKPSEFKWAILLEIVLWKVFGELQAKGMIPTYTVPPEWAAHNLNVVMILALNSFFLLRTKDEQEETLMEWDKIQGMKLTWLAHISHTLRAPVSAVIAAIKNVLSGRYGELPEIVVDELVDASGQLTSKVLPLINNSLAAANLNTGGKTEVIVALGTFGGVLHSVETMLKPKCKDLGIHLNVEVPEDEAPGQTDFNLVEQIVINVASNAQRFVLLDGSITLRAYQTGANTIIEVEDTGKGIPAEKIPTLFDRKIEMSATAAKDNHGNGLGLPMAKQITEDLGGKISVSSVEGEGTTFKIVLPSEYKEV